MNITSKYYFEIWMLGLHVRQNMNTIYEQNMNKIWTKYKEYEPQKNITFLLLDVIIHAVWNFVVVNGVPTTGSPTVTSTLLPSSLQPQPKRHALLDGTVMQSCPNYCIHVSLNYSDCYSAFLKEKDSVTAFCKAVRWHSAGYRSCGTKMLKINNY